MTASSLTNRQPASGAVTGGRLIAARVLGTLLVGLSIAKIVFPQPGLQGILFTAIAAAEGVLGLAMLSRRFVRVGLAAFVLLASAFVAYHVSKIALGEGQHSCGCAGARVEMTHGTALIVSGVLLAWGTMLRGVGSR